MPPKFNATRGESDAKEVEDVKGKHATARVAIICGTILLTVILSILSIGCVIAIWKDTNQTNDYVSRILPVISAMLSGVLVYLVGQRAQKNPD
jgi:nucleoside recognition membrane protein YjiH